MPAAKRKGTRKSSASSAKRQAVDSQAFNWSKAKATVNDDDMIASDDDSSSEGEGGEEEVGESGKRRRGNMESVESDEDDSDNEAESARDTRLRLANEYLDRLRAEDSDDDEEARNNHIADRLKEDVLESTGRVFKAVASKFADFDFDEESRRIKRGHKLSVTSVCLSNDDRIGYSASKDGSIIQWDIQAGTKSTFKLPTELRDEKDRKRAILSIDISHDGKYLVSGGADRLVRVWDTRSQEVVESFNGHRDTISSVCFIQKSLNLFTSSFDRTLKHWNLKEMGYVETLFGHQQDVVQIHALQQERVISVGRDRSARVWKIPEETQLILNATAGHGMTSFGSSLDSVQLLPHQHFVTGSDDGALALWSFQRKKPLFTLPAAHGSDSHWISSISNFHGTDLVASGSNDGFVRLWKADVGSRALEQVGAVPVDGYVNDMAFARSGRFIFAGVGQEHRLGRWNCNKKAKNGIALIALPSIDDENSSESDEEAEGSENQSEQEQEEESASEE